MKIDIHDYETQIKKEIQAIKEKLPKQNQKLILDYDLRYSQKLGLSNARRLILLNKLKLVCLKANKNLDKLTVEDIENLELRLIKDGLSKRSQKDFRSIIKQFYKWLDDEEGERWKWIKKNFQNHKVPPKTHRPEDFMDEEERQIFLQSAQTIFEKAIASIFLTSGCRAGEVGNMTVGSIQFLPEEKSAIIEVSGKTGERRIKLFEPTSSYLKAWVQQHPLRHDPQAPLWLNSVGQPYTYDGIAKILKRIGSRGGIKKPLNPHSFRHMIYTLFQLKGVPQAVREKYFGHVHGSPMAKIYTHASDQEVFNVLDELHGKARKTRDIRLEVKMKQCAKCLKTFLPDKSFCDECGLTLEKSVLEEQEARKTKEELVARVVELENALKETVELSKSTKKDVQTLKKILLKQKKELVAIR